MVVATAGAVLVVISGLADVVGIGDTSEFSLRQSAGVLGGVVAIVVGGLATRRPRS